MNETETPQLTDFSSEQLPTINRQKESANCSFILEQVLSPLYWSSFSERCKLIVQEGFLCRWFVQNENIFFWKIWSNTMCIVTDIWIWLGSRPHFQSSVSICPSPSYVLFSFIRCIFIRLHTSVSLFLCCTIQKDTSVYSLRNLPTDELVRFVGLRLHRKRGRHGRELFSLLWILIGGMLRSAIALLAGKEIPIRQVEVPPRLQAQGQKKSTGLWGDGTSQRGLIERLGSWWWRRSYLMFISHWRFNNFVDWREVPLLSVPPACQEMTSPNRW